MKYNSHLLFTDLCILVLCAIFFLSLLTADPEPVRDKPQEVVPGHHFVQE